MSVTDLPLKSPRPPREGRALQKGQQTKAAIVDTALGLATQIGLEGLSIGALAEVTQMSKSGVFAHFGSREELQISVIREYHHRFEQEVFYPAMAEATARLSSSAMMGFGTMTASLILARTSQAVAVMNMTGMRRSLQIV